MSKCQYCKTKFEVDPNDTNYQLNCDPYSHIKFHNKYFHRGEGSCFDCIRSFESQGVIDLNKDGSIDLDDGHVLNLEKGMVFDLYSEVSGFMGYGSLVEVVDCPDAGLLFEFDILGSNIKPDGVFLMSEVIWSSLSPFPKPEPLVDRGILTKRWCATFHNMKPMQFRSAKDALEVTEGGLCMIWEHLDGKWLGKLSNMMRPE